MRVCLLSLVIKRYSCGSPLGHLTVPVRKSVWRIELAFGGGEAAWIIPNRTKNAEEVFNFVAALPRAYLKNS